MLALLVLFGGLHHARAIVSEIPKNTSFVIRQNVSCPASGFFLQRELSPNSLGHDMCYLCFCQDNETAVCWKRNSRGCDMKHFHAVAKRNSRARRNILSLGETFSRDAARDFFNNQSPEKCKPFETSFSDGCPLANLCAICTICDCNANSEWDCRVLNLCPDKKGKKQKKKPRGHSRYRMAKRQSKISAMNISLSINSTTKPPIKPTRLPSVTVFNIRNQMKQSSVINKHKINEVKASKVNKFSTVKKPLPKLQAKKAIPSRNRVTRRPLYIKKNVSTTKPLTIKTIINKTENNNTAEVAQKVVKQFLTTMQKVTKNFDLKANKTSKAVNKVIKKRSRSKQDIKQDTKELKQRIQFVTNPVLNILRKDFGKTNTLISDNSTMSKYGRLKRHAKIVENISNENNSYTNYSHRWSGINKTDENVITNRTQNLLANNSMTSIFNIPQNFNIKTVNLTQLKSSMNQAIDISNNNIHGNKESFVKNRTLQNSVNNTGAIALWTTDNYDLQQNTLYNNVEQIILLTTDRSYLSTNFIEFNNKNENNIKLNLVQKNKDRENISSKNEIQDLNVSTETGDHSYKFLSLLQKLNGTRANQCNNTIKCIEISKTLKRYTILNKISRILKKIFNKRNRNELYDKDDMHYIDYDIKQSDYEKLGNCTLDSKEKEILRRRIYNLKRESENILKTIGIIKRFLNILETNTNEAQYNVSRDFNGTNGNIDKLNKIVKNSYYNEENSMNFTEDQRTNGSHQKEKIDNIKNNVQVFIKSIGKFAKVLNSVIETVAYCNKKDSKVRSENVSKKTKAMNNTENTTQTKVEKLKKLIMNYNLLQNKFTHQIYHILNNFGANFINKDNLKHTMFEHYVELNKTNTIETNSVNIIKNIRKLKLLADKINVQGRSKRQTIDDDDALEYLLILMEYLLKRHNPAYPSANDGLDLLIEAIKSAPDIKLIRKKVLDNITEKSFVTRTVTPINSLKKYSNNFTSHVIGVQKKSSTDINRNIKIADQVEDDDDDDEDKIEEIYRYFKSNNLNSNQKQNENLLSNSNVSITSTIQEEKATSRTSNKKHNRFLGYQTARDSLEKEINATPTTMSGEFDTTSVRSATDYSNDMNVNFKKRGKANGKSENLLVDSKANIDWIEENFKEIKQSREVEIRSSTPKSRAATRTLKHIDNVSDITNESETYNRKKDDKTNAEEVISKKQLDLLNSLDYVEDEVDSKDDKFLSDTYV